MAKIKTRVLIISDTHCAQLSRHEDSDSGYPIPPFKSPLPDADLLIHCGDLTHNGKIEQYHRTLDMLKEINAPVKAVIAGNHDLTLDPEFVQSHAQTAGAQGAWKPPGSEAAASDIVKEARQLWASVNGRARQEGVLLLDEGIHSLDLKNGARVKVYASPYTPEFCDWSFAYKHKEDRFNAADQTLSDAVNITTNPIPSFSTSDSIDILITHGPPYASPPSIDAMQTTPSLLRSYPRRLRCSANHMGGQRRQCGCEKIIH